MVIFANIALNKVHIFTHLFGIIYNSVLIRVVNSFYFEN